MRCPSCGTGDLTAGTRFCPACGVALANGSGGAAVQVRQTAEHITGRMVGVQTEVIQGDVYGGDIYQAQVYVLTGAGRDADWRRFLSEATPPYKGLASYTVQDHAVFKGRDSEVRQIVRRIGEGQVTVLYGAPGVGKTSLMAAGAIPKLIDNGELVLHVHDYHEPEASIRAALAACADHVRLTIPDGASLPDILVTIADTTHGSLVLVLDQFERLFDPALGEDRRTSIVADLAASIRRVPQELLRLVIVVQEQYLSQLDRLQDRLPNLLNDAIRLPLLDRAQARTAIEEPLTVRHYPVSFVADLVPERLIPELEDLTPGEAGIQPGQLQIVCRALYDDARDRRPPLIDDQLYRALKGADGIFASYMATTLDTRMAGDRDAARQIMVTMASPGVGPWLAADAIVGDGAPPGELARVMARLAEEDLLVSRANGDAREYAFANAVVAREARRLGGRDVEERFMAEEEVERVWAAWLSHDDALATRGQLRLLRRSASFLAPAPVKLLLLLRSSVAHDDDAAVWLGQLRAAGGHELIEQLEEADLADRQPLSPATREQATEMLGLDAVPLPDISGNGHLPFGSVAWAAVRHPEPVSRRTAGLALLTMDAHIAVDRLNWALASGFDGWGRRRRRAEVWGTLADGDDEFAARFVEQLPRPDQISVWLSRVWRRIVASQQRLAWLAIGGALGVGAMLGLLRALIGTLLLDMKAAPFSAPHFYNGALIGAALGIGLALADPIMLRSPFGPDHMQTRKQPQANLVAATVLLTAFGLAHFVVAMLNGLPPTTALIQISMGFAAGIGLAFAFYGYDPDGPRSPFGKTLARLCITALGLFVAQLVYLWLWTNSEVEAIAIGLDRSFYSGRAFGITKNAQWTIPLNSGWATAATLVDAALVGAAIAAGVIIGLRIATRRLERWRRLADQAWD